MDPLSVSASVVGLIAAAAQISQVVGNVIKRSKNAPKECHDVRLEVDTIRGTLVQLQVCNEQHCPFLALLMIRRGSCSDLNRFPDHEPH